RQCPPRSRSVLRRCSRRQLCIIRYRSSSSTTSTTMENSELSKEQMKILKDAFDAFDIEKKGFISLEVVGTILDLLGYALSEEELKEVMEDYDLDESGQIEFEEFIELASNYVEPDEDYDVLRAELREVFMMYDKDGTGYIPVKEFKEILRELDNAVPENDLDQIVDEIDADGSGTVDFEEFMEVMTGPQD
uniref:EF-hand domain-containing protein n=1 Tax=Anopheles farauti TaxID=69004 RepID=A0A182QF05_9DIPT